MSTANTARGFVIFTIIGIAVASATPCEAQVSLDARSVREQAADRVIRQALQSRISVRYHEQRLGDIVSSLRQQLGINILLDERALDSVGVIPATLVTLEMTDVTFESVLEAMLKQLELSWMTRYESLVITTPEVTESNLQTRLYPVADLVLAEYEHVIYEDEQILIDTIKSIVEPQSWDDVGGPGAIAYLPNSRALIISQTRPVHDHVEGLVTTLRKVKRMQGIPDVHAAVRALDPEQFGLDEEAAKQLVSPRSPAAPQRGYTYQSGATWRVPRVHK
jgi:hypothetical protein